jgi:acetyltransferase-like isoleucine patch superfamily enzyme
MKAVREIGFKKTWKYLFFAFWQVIFHLLTFSPLRKMWLTLFGAKIGGDSIIGDIIFMNLYRKGISGLTLGSRCFVGDRVVFDLAEEINIGDDSTLSEECFILTHTNVGYTDHPLQKEIQSFSAKVIVGSGCFIGIRSVIMPGITLGGKCAIGACSFVNNDIPAGELHAGIPAKLIRKLS